MDLADIARKLDREEALRVKYLCPIRSKSGEGINYEERVGELLDVSVETRKLFVRCNSEIIWIKPEEAIALLD